jgi:prophage regulatory protein
VQGGIEIPFSLLGKGNAVNMSTLTHPTFTRTWLRPTHVAKKLGISPSAFWELCAKDPEFPKKIKLGARTTLFAEDEIDAYMAKKAGN